MPETEPVKVKVKISSLIALALAGTIFIQLHGIAGENHNAWQLALEGSREFLIATGMMFLVFQIMFPIHISPEGLQRNIFFTKQAVIPWGEVDFDRIKRNKFTPVIWIGSSWLQHRNIILPGYFHIANSEEVLSLIDEHKKNTATLKLDNRIRQRGQNDKQSSP